MKKDTILVGDDLRDILTRVYKHSLSCWLGPLIYCKPLTPLFKLLFAPAGSGDR